MEKYSSKPLYMFICPLIFDLDCIVHCVFLIKVKGEGEESFFVCAVWENVCLIRVTVFAWSPGPPSESSFEARQASQPTQTENIFSYQACRVVNILYINIIVNL